MSAALPNCDGCGRFTANGVEIESTKPDFWNGPDVTFYCPRCLNIARSAWFVGFRAARRGPQFPLVAEESVSIRTRGEERMTECRIEIIEGQPVRVHGDRPMTDEDRAAFTEVVRAARKMMAETPRHFAPYGSTAALCGAPVPRLIGWDEKRAEYRSILFTAHRGEATCEECWRKITTVAATHENEDPV